MADIPRSPDLNGDANAPTRREPSRDTPPRTPRWVNVFGGIVLVVILLVVISLLAGVRHGPGLHTAPSSITAPLDGDTPPFSSSASGVYHL